MTYELHPGLQTCGPDFSLIRSDALPLPGMARRMVDDIADSFGHQTNLPGIEIVEEGDKYEATIRILSGFIVLVKIDTESQRTCYWVLIRRGSDLILYDRVIQTVYQVIMRVGAKPLQPISELVDGNPNVRLVENYPELVDLLGLWKVKSYGHIQRHFYPCYAIFSAGAGHSELTLFQTKEQQQ